MQQMGYHKNTTAGGNVMRRKELSEEMVLHLYTYSTEIPKGYSMQAGRDFAFFSCADFLLRDENSRSNPEWTGHLNL